MAMVPAMTSAGMRVATHHTGRFGPWKKKASSSEVSRGVLRSALPMVMIAKLVGMRATRRISVMLTPVNSTIVFHRRAEITIAQPDSHRATAIRMRRRHMTVRRPPARPSRSVDPWMMRITSSTTQAATIQKLLTYVTSLGKSGRARLLGSPLAGKKARSGRPGQSNLAVKAAARSMKAPMTRVRRARRRQGAFRCRRAGAMLLVWSG